jgi:hypothetical protein
MVFLKIICAALLLQAAASPQSGTGSIEGIVTSTSREALSKVTVTLSRAAAPIVNPTAPGIPPSANPNPTATTDADGKFVFSNLLPGSYRVRAARQGFVGSEYGQKGLHGIGNPVSVTAGQKVNGIAMVITPQGAITGRIVDPNGMPVSRAMVQALQYVYQGPALERSLTDIQTVTTDDLGNYRLFWLAPGSYFITAAPSGSYSIGFRSTQLFTTVSAIPVTNNGVTAGSRARSDGSWDEESWVPAFYPGTPNAKEAVPVVVRAGATVSGIDVGIVSAPVYRIRGVTINGDTGKPEAMRVQLLSADSGAFPGSLHFSSDFGTFEIAGVKSGAYILSAQADTGTGFLPVSVGNADVTNVILNTKFTSFTISGRMIMDGVSSNGSVLNPGSRIRLAGTNPSAPSPQLLTQVSGAEITFRGLLPGEYQMTLEGNSRQYIKSIRYGNQDGMDGFHVESPSGGPLEIVVSSSTGSIDGRVVNERREPVLNATVVVIPDPPLRQRMSMYLTSEVDASGKFHVDAMPGRYKVFAWEDVETGAWLDPIFMNDIESRGHPINVIDGGTEAVEINVIPYMP